MTKDKDTLFPSTVGKVMERVQEFTEATRHLNLTEYVVKGRPMDVRQTLLKEANQRWKGGTGPWSKDPGELDQVDLVFLESLPTADSALVKVLVAEVRNARGWPTPLDVKLDVKYT